MKPISLILSTIALLAGVSSITKADGDAKDLQALQQALQALQQRVEILESIKPTFTGFMPNMAERFHVLHRAGDAGDWAVAGHELAEIKRLSALSQYIDADKGAMMQAMMGPSYETLEEAIEHGNRDELRTALDGTVKACNACHVATGSPFVQVVLDAEKSISMRHPHALAQTEMAGGHAHGEPAMMQMMQQNMKNAMGAEAGHDDNEEPHDDAGEEAHHDGDKHQN